MHVLHPAADRYTSCTFKLRFIGWEHVTCRLLAKHRKLAIQKACFSLKLQEIKWIFLVFLPKMGVHRMAGHPSGQNLGHMPLHQNTAVITATEITQTRYLYLIHMLRLIDHYWSLHPVGHMSWIFWHLWGFLCTVKGRYPSAVPRIFGLYCRS